jgi:hypothetical protein
MKTCLASFILEVVSPTITDNMAIKSGVSGDVKLFNAVLVPSWLSGMVVVLASVAIVGGTVLLAHVGYVAHQSLLGLQSLYADSSIGKSVLTVSDNLAQNTSLNNALLFLMWSSVGLVVYSVLQGLLHELKQAGGLLHEIEDAPPPSRGSVLRAATLRAVVRLGALAGWWLLFRFTIYTLLPQVIGAAHFSALHLTYIHGWLRSLLAVAVLIFVLHGLVVLLRLVMLRPRLVGSDIIL